MWSPNEIPYKTEYGGYNVDESVTEFENQISIQAKLDPKVLTEIILLRLVGVKMIYTYKVQSEARENRVTVVKKHENTDWDCIGPVVNP